MMIHHLKHYIKHACWKKRQKTLQKCQQVCFVLVIYCWAWVLTWNVIFIPSKHPLEKTKFCFARSYQLEMASWLGIGAHAYFSSQHWDPVWLEPVQALYAPIVSVSSLYTSSVVFGTLCPWCHPSVLALMFYLLLPIVPWDLIGGVWWRHPI